jgi:hypothetical protein
MIDRSDEEPRFVTADTAPQYIGFNVKGEEIGRLWLEDPLRFEGNAEESAAVFFQHIVAGSDQTHQHAKRLLEAGLDATDDLVDDHKILEWRKAVEVMLFGENDDD